MHCSLYRRSSCCCFGLVEMRWCNLSDYSNLITSLGNDRVTKMILIHHHPKEFQDILSAQSVITTPKEFA